MAPAVSKVTVPDEGESLPPLLESDFPEPPPSTRCVLQVRQDEVTITSPRQRPHPVATVIVAILVLVYPSIYGAMFIAAAISEFHKSPLLVAGIIFGIVAGALLICTLIVGHYIADHTQTTTMTATRTRLTISTKRAFLRTRENHWDRVLQTWVDNAPTWLQIGRPERAITFLDNRSLEEKRWLAEVLYVALRLENPCPRQPDELAVSFGSGPDARLKPGFLWARPGVLVLRYHTERQADYGFFDPQLKGAAGWARLALKQWPVSPDDITGTDDEDGWCWIHVVQGRVSVTIGCQDQVALHSAVARFRGASSNSEFVQRDNEGGDPESNVRQCRRHFVKCANHRRLSRS